MKLDDFMHQTRVRNTYVSEDGWLSLYVRKGDRYICGQRRSDVLDLANFEATEKGNGTFKKLIERIQRDYPEYTIYVENVLTAQFVDGLARMGFELILPIDGFAPSFYLDPKRSINQNPKRVNREMSKA